jgi:hypothetical protein
MARRRSLCRSRQTAEDTRLADRGGCGSDDHDNEGRDAVDIARARRLPKTLIDRLAASKRGASNERSSAVDRPRSLADGYL